MTKYVKHDLKVKSKPDEIARQNFMLNMRSYVMLDMAMGMKKIYDYNIEPNFKKSKKRKPKNGDEIHKIIKKDIYFKFYSSIRCNAQEMVFRSVMPPIERSINDLKKKAKTLSTSKKTQGSLNIDKNLPIPKSVSNLDVHLMPGCYHSEHSENDLSQGALYDNGVSVFSMGFFGEKLDDIGSSISLFIKKKYPNFKPLKILDLGCTVGHNTLPWSKAYPKAEIHAVDVGAPVLRYAHARAQSEGVSVHFHQQNAEKTNFKDNSFDLVFSSMFLHEVPRRGIKQILKEAKRLLRPGGLMLHMELPPNKMLDPYNSFYLDWDSYYNKEPFYKPFRDMIPEKVCADAGFSKNKFVQFIIPSIGQFGEKEIIKSIGSQNGNVDDRTGRFTKGIHWYCFGSWK